MKHALIITSIGGFLPQFLGADISALKKYGYEVHYASNFRNTVYPFSWKKMQSEGIRCHDVGLKKKPWAVIENTVAFIRLLRLIRDENIDLIHCHNPIGGVLGRLAGAVSSRHPAVIYTAHGFHFYKGAPLFYWLLFYPVERCLSHLTDTLITINREDEASSHRFRLRSGKNPVMIHGVGVDLSRFSPKEELYDEVRRELDVPEGAFHIVSAGELNRNKNHAVILEAMKILNDPDIVYTICGSGKDRAKLVKQIRELGLKDRVRLAGYRTDMERILNSADCFAFPSIREGFGIAAVEALATGIPVIATDNRGTREYMQDERNGLICNASDPGSFADAIRRMKEDSEFRSECAEYARKSALEFSLELAEENMRRIYAEVCR